MGKRVLFAGNRDDNFMGTCLLTLFIEDLQAGFCLIDMLHYKLL